MKRLLHAACIALACSGASAQTPPGAAGSAGFCLFALPSDNGSQRWINLGIVQFVDVHADYVQITYGGGNLGSGHEAKLPLKSRDEAPAILARLRQTAEDCARRPLPNLILREDRK